MKIQYTYFFWEKFIELISKHERFPISKSTAEEAVGCELSSIILNK